MGKKESFLVLTLIEKTGYRKKWLVERGILVTASEKKTRNLRATQHDNFLGSPKGKG